MRLGLRAKFPEIEVELYASGGDAGEVDASLAQAETWARERLGDIVFSDAEESMAGAVGRLLRARGGSLALAESCTGRAPRALADRDAGETPITASSRP